MSISYLQHARRLPHRNQGAARQNQAAPCDERPPGAILSFWGYPKPFHARVTSNKSDRWRESWFQKGGFGAEAWVEAWVEGKR